MIFKILATYPTKFNVSRMCLVTKKQLKLSLLLFLLFHIKIWAIYNRWTLQIRIIIASIFLLIILQNLSLFIFLSLFGLMIKPITIYFSPIFINLITKPRLINIVFPAIELFKLQHLFIFFR